MSDDTSATFLVRSSSLTKRVEDWLLENEWQRGDIGESPVLSDVWSHWKGGIVCASFSEAVDVQTSRSLIELDEAKRAADKAIQTVGENANELWMRKARRSLAYVARMNVSFTTDDVWADMALVDEFAATHEPRAMGAVMRRAVKEGVCTATPMYQPSVRVECHARPVRVWISLVSDNVRRTCHHEPMIGVEYEYGHPGRFDGVSEWKCSVCNQRYGRWTGRLLVGDDYEKRYGGQYEV